MLFSSVSAGGCAGVSSGAISKRPIGLHLYPDDEGRDVIGPVPLERQLDEPLGHLFGGRIRRQDALERLVVERSVQSIAAQQQRLGLAASPLVDVHVELLARAE